MYIFFKKSMIAIFLMMTFSFFIGFFILGALGLSNIGYNSNYRIFFLNLLYFAGVLPFFFSLWLVFSEKTRGDWKFGLISLVIFFIFLYYHYLSLYTLSIVPGLKYLVLLNEVILFYVLRGIVVALSVGLNNDGVITYEQKLEAQKKRFRLLFTFFLLSLFALHFYSGLNNDLQNWQKGHYLFLTQYFRMLFNSGLLPLIFILWLLYSPLVRGNIYYYIMLASLLILLYCFQQFYIVYYNYHYPNQQNGYWILEAMAVVFTYFSINVSIVFADHKKRSDKTQVNKKLEENCKSD
jgi:membrane protein